MNANTENLKQLSRRAMTEIDKGNLDVMDGLCAPGAAFHFAGIPPQDLSGFKQFCRMFYAAFPDLKHDVKEMVAEGDKVVRMGVFHGTHRADFQGLPATGRRIEVPFAGMDTFRDGKLVKLEAMFDSMILMQQLGAIPAPASAA